MQAGSDALIPRTGPASKISAGPKVGQRSLYHQQVLDEDTYTEALSHIITRDFFPNLPHIHATNSYLSALTNNDPELLSSSIRRLAALSKEKEDKSRLNPGSTSTRSFREEFDNHGTPYISKPGRTPLGGREWDTPAERPRRERDILEGDEEEEDDEGETPGPSSRPRKKQKRKARPPPKVRDDLSLDAFQRNYTSEDNASFVQIVDEDNRRRREEKAWAFEAAEKAKQRRLEGEERRKMILDTAVNGTWRVGADGRRLIGGLAEGGRDRAEGEVWKEPLSIEGKSSEEEHSNTGSALVLRSDGALIKLDNANAPEEKILPPSHPLAEALVAAGLPSTALVSKEDGAIVPVSEVGSGGTRGRGVGEQQRRDKIESAIMGEAEQEHLALAGSGVDQWGYKTRNNFMFPADADVDPYPKLRPLEASSRQPPKAISHNNTRLPEDNEESSATARSRRGSSPASSWVDAAVKGQPYKDASVPMVGNYPLLPNDPSPSPEELPSLLTWGTLMATPRALDASGDPLDSTPSFRMPETKRRDEIGRKLGNKASKAMNDRAKGYTPRHAGSGLSALKAAADRTQRAAHGVTSGRMLPPSTPRRDNLTPAAKRLLDSSLGLGKSASTRNRGAAMEKNTGWTSNPSKSKDMSWTPSPYHRR